MYKFLKHMRIVHETKKKREMEKGCDAYDPDSANFSQSYVNAIL